MMHTVIRDARLTHGHGAGVEEHVVGSVGFGVGHKASYMHWFHPSCHVAHVKAGTNVGIVDCGPGPRHDQVQGSRGGRFASPGQASHQHDQPHCQPHFANGKLLAGSIPFFTLTI